MIRDMEEKEDDMGMRNGMVECLNQWEEVTLVWIPGHRGIVGNEAADKVAKACTKEELLRGGRWKEADYEEGAKRVMRRLREEEWKKWHAREGHEYYERKPQKPKHLKGLSRMDEYILMRLRSGTDKTGHENCRNFEFRHHIAMCEKYAKGRPELSTLYDDKKIGTWKEWWERHECLAFGIPTSLPEQLGVRVMYGNPFDSTITISKNGETVCESILKTMKACKYCNNYHRGKCKKKVLDVRAGRWFFIGDGELECKMCGGKYGGGSTSRPGGSGLKAHLNRQKPKVCGDKWESEYWKETRERWDEKEEIERITLVVKWMELFMKDIKNCLNCSKGYTTLGNLRVHVRKEKECFEMMEKVVKENLLEKD